MLGKTLAAFHLAGAILSFALLVSTFFAKGMITTKARQHAIEKTRSLSDPLTEKLQETLDSTVTGSLIRGSVRERIETELSSYRTSPDAWLLQLAEGGPNRAKDFDFPEVQQPLARKTLDAVSGQVAKLKDHLEASYRDLIRDLRIFAGTNLAAFLFAAWICSRPAPPLVRFWFLVLSAILLVSAGFSILVYLDQNWTWTILTRNYIGWGYPALLGMVALYLSFKIGPSLSDMKPTPEKQS